MSLEARERLMVTSPKELSGNTGILCLVKIKKGA